MASVPRKVRRLGLSKNRSRAVWRKHSNVADVEEFLDQEREDARMGGPSWKSKDDDIFAVEDVLTEEESVPLNASQIIEEEGPAVLSVVGGLTKDTRKPARTDNSLWKELRCFKSLVGDRDPQKPKPHGNKSLEDKATRLQKIANRAIARKATKRTPKPVGIAVDQSKPVPEVVPAKSAPLSRKDAFRFDRNLWADGAAAQVAKEMDQRPLAITKPKQAPPTLRLRKTSAIRAVQIPHAGISYNPLPQDHQDVLNFAGKKAWEKAAEEKRLMEFSKTKRAVERSADEMWMDEMQEGLPNAAQDVSSEQTEVPDEKPGYDADDGRKALSMVRKTKRDRRKEKMLLEQGTKRLETKKKRTRDNEVFRSRKILRELKEKESEDARKGLLRKSKREDPGRTLRLGRHRFLEADPEVQLKDELCSGLRTLQPEGSLLLDRYKSLQRRSIVEPRFRQKAKRKYKLKTYQIPGRKLVV